MHVRRFILFLNGQLLYSPLKDEKQADLLTCRLVSDGVAHLGMSVKVRCNAAEL